MLGRWWSHNRPGVGVHGGGEDVHNGGVLALLRLPRHGRLLVTSNLPLIWQQLRLLVLGRPPIPLGAAAPGSLPPLPLLPSSPPLFYLSGGTEE